MSHILYLKLIHNVELSRRFTALATNSNTQLVYMLIFVRLSDCNLHEHIPDANGCDKGIRMTLTPGHF